MKHTLVQITCHEDRLFEEIQKAITENRVTGELVSISHAYLGGSMFSVLAVFKTL